MFISEGVRIERPAAVEDITARPVCRRHAAELWEQVNASPYMLERDNTRKGSLTTIRHAPAYLVHQVIPFWSSRERRVPLDIGKVFVGDHTRSEKRRNGSIREAEDSSYATNAIPCAPNERSRPTEHDFEGTYL